MVSLLIRTVAFLALPNMIHLAIAKAWHKFFTDKIEELILGETGKGAAEMSRMCDDAACNLGKWIYGEGAALAGIPAYDRLKKVHMGFHEYACRFLSASISPENGKLADARDDFRHISSEVILAIDQLEDHVNTIRQQNPAAYPSIVIPAAEGIAWDDVLTLGLPVIDQQHMAIVSLYNKLSELAQSSPSPEAITDFLTEIGTVLKIHFDTEEAMMARLGMNTTEIEAHKEEHQTILDDLARFNRNLMDNPGVQLEDFLETARKWTIDHIVNRDLDIRRYVTR